MDIVFVLDTETSSFKCSMFPSRSYNFLFSGSKNVVTLRKQMVAFSKPERQPLNAKSYPQWKKNCGIDKQDFPRIVHPSVYVLALEDGKYYVGLATHGCEFRIGEHCGNMGSKWSQEYEALHVIDFYYPASKKLEKQLTVYYAHKYGAANVRGGPYCSSPPPGIPMQPVSSTDQECVDLVHTEPASPVQNSRADDHVRE